MAWLKGPWGPPPAGPLRARPRPILEAFDYESVRAGYYDEVFRRHRGMQSKWHHLKFERVARELEGCRRVLDVGCGPGTLAGNFGAGHDWVGTDLSTRQIDYARRSYGQCGPRFYQESPAGVHVDEGPFAAALGWRFADRVAELERGTLEKRLGLLLIGSAVKPAL